MSKQYRSWKAAERARTEACRCAAMVMAGRPDADAWSLAVFFESYIAGGSKATAKVFGPKSPAKLKVVRE